MHERQEVAVGVGDGAKILSVALAAAWLPSCVVLFIAITDGSRPRLRSIIIISGGCAILVAVAAAFSYETISYWLKVVLIIFCALHLLTFIPLDEDQHLPVDEVSRWRRSPGFLTSVLVFLIIVLAEHNSLIPWAIILTVIAMSSTHDFRFARHRVAHFRQVAAKAAEEKRLRAARTEEEKRRREQQLAAQKLRDESSRINEELRRRAIDEKIKERQEASRRTQQMADDEARAREFRLLRAIYRATGGLTDYKVPLADMRTANELNADVWVTARRLEQENYLSIEEVDLATWSDWLSLTPKGARFVRIGQTNPIGNSTVNVERLYMGDDIKAGPGAVVINRSRLKESVVTIRSRHGDEMAAALEKIAAAVAASNSREAAENLDEFNKELQASVPRKSILKSLFQGVLTGAPAISNLTESVSKVAELFN